jgi:membrane protease YdiL (CAAX protease family)
MNITADAKPILSRALRQPVLVCLVLLAIALVFRLIDIFVLRLDERLGEIILSKALGFALVVLFVWLAGRKLRDIGLHSRALGPSLLIGASVTLVALIVGYAVELLVLASSGSPATLQFAAIDPKAGVSGGFVFALWLVLGNFVNSFMEEGLFRGIMIPLFRIRLSFWRTNWLQAILFGAWHLPWAIKWYQTGVIETPGEITMGVVTNFFPQILLGLVWGYMFLKTGNLWTSWIAHTLTNTTLNLLHTVSASGLDSGISLRMTAYSIVALLGMFLVKYLARRFALPEVQPWEPAISSAPEKIHLDAARLKP